MFPRSLSRRALLVSALSLILAETTTAQQPYGRGTAGTGGVTPSLSCARPRVGDAGFSLQLDQANPNTLGFAFVAVGEGFLPFGGLELWLNPATIGANLSAPVDSQGRADFALPIPNRPELIGNALHAQSFVFDNAGPLNLAASRGLRIGFGDAPRVFVGCSILRNDPFYLVDPASGMLVDQGAATQTDNVTGAAFDFGGERIFTASSIRGLIGVGDATTIPISWQTLWVSGGSSTYGLNYDARRELVWTLTDPAGGGGSRELVAIDANANSPSYGTLVHSTTGMLTGTAEIFGTSSSGDVTAVLTYLPNSLTVVDTNPQSPTFLQNLHAQQPIPVDQASGFTLATRTQVTPDERYVLITLQGIGNTPTEIARFDIQSGTWVDHDPLGPGQNIGPSLATPILMGSAPTTLRIANDGSYALVGGFGNCGWVGRLDLDPSDPLNVSWTPFTGSSPLSNGWTGSLSPDQTQVAVATWPDTGCSNSATPELVFFDVATGTETGVQQLPSNSNGSNQNLYTVIWR